jgi:hypothetical protein
MVLESLLIIDINNGSTTVADNPILSAMTHL